MWSQGYIAPSPIDSSASSVFDFSISLTDRRICYIQLNWTLCTMTDFISCMRISWLWIAVEYHFCLSLSLRLSVGVSLFLYVSLPLFLSVSLCLSLIVSQLSNLVSGVFCSMHFIAWEIAHVVVYFSQRLVFIWQMQIRVLRVFMALVRNTCNLWLWLSRRVNPHSLHTMLGQQLVSHFTRKDI